MEKHEDNLKFQISDFKTENAAAGEGGDGCGVATQARQEPRPTGVDCKLQITDCKGEEARADEVVRQQEDNLKFQISDFKTESATEEAVAVGDAAVTVVPEVLRGDAEGGRVALKTVEGGQGAAPGSRFVARWRGC